MPRMTTPNSAQPVMLTARYAADASASTWSSRGTIPSLIARRTSSQLPLWANACTIAPPSSSASQPRRWATWRRSRRRPVGGLRGNRVLTEQRGDRAAAREQLRRRSLLDDLALVQDGDPVGQRERGEP